MAASTKQRCVRRPFDTVGGASALLLRFSVKPSTPSFVPLVALRESYTISAVPRRGGGRLRPDLPPLLLQFALIPAALITLAHFSVSSAMSLPKSAGDIGIGVPPKSASRAFITGLARAALISLLSFSIISAGVFLGTPMPYQCSPHSPARNRPRSGCPAAPPSASRWSPPARAACRP